MAMKLLTKTMVLRGYIHLEFKKKAFFVNFSKEKYFNFWVGNLTIKKHTHSDICNFFFKYLKHTGYCVINKIDVNDTHWRFLKMLDIYFLLNKICCFLKNKNLSSCFNVAFVLQY